jgi:hypothetical protein
LSSFLCVPLCIFVAKIRGGFGSSMDLMNQAENVIIFF